MVSPSCVRKDLLVSTRGTSGPILNGIPSQLPDTDPEETKEWLESLQGVIAVSYTHLTLPTGDLVEISVVAVSLKKKKKEH